MRRDVARVLALVAMLHGCVEAAPPRAPALPEIPAPPALWPPDPRLVMPLPAPLPSSLAASVPLAPGPPTRTASAPSLASVDDENPGNKLANESIAAAAPPPSPRLAPLPDAEPGPIPKIVVEAPYKLGERPEPRSQDAYRREIHELRHWGAGGTGELAEALPGPEGHPDPRVVVNVERVSGAHDVAEVTRLARRNHWLQVVRCYRLGAYKDPELRGWTKVLATIARGGVVSHVELLETELGERAVAECMAQKLKALKLPTARGASKVRFEMRVGPGDEPMPPPEELIVPGDGFLSPTAMRDGLRPAEPEFEACYRRALERAPGLWGRILVRFHVTERGKVDEAFQAGTQFPDPRMSQCVLRAARRLSFSKPEGGELRFVFGLRFSSDRSRHELPDLPPSTRRPARQPTP
jgi:hypothetical protein